MKITDVTSELFEWEKPPIWNGKHYYSVGRLHKVTVYTDSGITGVGWNGGTAAERPLKIFPNYVEYYKNMLINKNPLETKSLVENLGTQQIKIFGPAGLHTQVLAAINIACWDIKGKFLDKSIHNLLGGHKKRIPTYIAGGYYAEGKGLSELKDELSYNVEVLHAKAVKIKIGDPNYGLKNDMKRVEASRNAIGDDIGLMVDANCALSLNQAIEFSKELSDYNVYWFEEPLPIHDYDGHTKLKNQSTMNIATGENGYHLEHFKNLTEKDCASIFNVDVAICPGYDVAFEISQMAMQHNISISPHGCQELQLPLVAGIENGGFLEYYPKEVDPLRSEMFHPILKPDKDGYVTVPDTPGLGYDLNMDLLKKYQVL
ncbi:MAG: mandelate racemase/muconate lactonizing enzyme family protein [SAR202 cluster bacterium]|nr:mandelate racemase/muconate lactonizing enzyme family protein [SAR202 cluster bacterium]